MLTLIWESSCLGELESMRKMLKCIDHIFQKCLSLWICVMELLFKRVFVFLQILYDIGGG